MTHSPIYRKVASPLRTGKDLVRTRQSRFRLARFIGLLTFDGSYGRAEERRRPIAGTHRLARLEAARDIFPRRFIAPESCGAIHHTRFCTF